MEKEIKDFSCKYLKEMMDKVMKVEEEKQIISDKLAAFNKDKEIEALKREIKDLRHKSVAILSDKEFDSIKEFGKEHWNTCKNKATQIIVESTGIGNVIKVKCKKCGEIQDVTDIDSW